LRFLHITENKNNNNNCNSDEFLMLMGQDLSGQE